MSPNTRVPHTGVNVTSKSDSTNKMRGVLGGRYELPYPMEHMLEIEALVTLFKPQPLYGEVEDAVTDKPPAAREGQERACESCGEVQECGGFEYEPYFSDEEYLRILARSGACSLDCLIKYAFRGTYAPTVSEFKNNPSGYKTLRLVDTTVEEVRNKFLDTN